MEVFMHNVPGHLTERSLQAQLEPFMTKLSISDYHCEKAKKKKFANVTFLHRDDGERFLREHGQEDNSIGLQNQWGFNAPRDRGQPSRSANQRGQRSRANLVFMNTPIYCLLSTRHAEGEPDGHPNPMTLRGISFAAEEREQRSEPAEKPSRDDAVAFTLRAWSCGYCTFTNGHFQFVPEISRNAPGVVVKLTKRYLQVKLPSNFDIRISLTSVVELIWSASGLLTLVLHTSPSFYSSSDDELSSILSQLGVVPSRSWGPSRSRICSLDEKHAKVVGQCLVYQFEIFPDGLYEKMRQLERQETMVITSHDFVCQSLPSPRLGDFTTQMETLNVELAVFDERKILPFGILFQLQALAYNAYLHPGAVIALARELRRAFTADKSAGRRPISVDAMKRLFEKIDFPLPNGEQHHFDANFLISILRRNQDEIHHGYLMPQGHNLARINRAMVTPTRITLHGPEMEAQNRILRKFPKHHDYFIRVQFCEEDGSDLHFNPKVSLDPVYDRFRSILQNEIIIAGRKYTFLGFSHSSLRAHSVWFSCPFLDDNNKQQTYSTIISELGNFSNIRSPARCAARIGQAFSETPFAVPLKENEIFVTKIEDITSPDRTRVFSDGVGTMSWDVMVATWGYLSQTKNSPTCFQVRLGGAKGMLAVDSRLSGSIIQIRDSMIKFPTKDMNNLEICDVASKPISLVLNRQLIKILEDIGVPNDWFFEMQNQELAHLRAITSNASNTADFLKAQRISDSIGLHKLIRYCDLVGIDYRRDEFLRSVVELTVLRVLRLLKHKARIPVKKGITLFGVIDETGYLQEGEVFVIFGSMSGRYPHPPSAERILISRSPALHPGDVQVANNVIPPDGHPLKAHNNCVVFSSKGPRDLPSQLSGGDLDGDIYHIIWDQDAQPTTTFPAADYPRMAPLDIGRSITKDDMASFFVTFMKTDQLGLICTRHMILADQKEEGTLDKDCLALAEMASTAVDFSKTGIEVDMLTMPRCSKFRPDFLAPGPQTKLIDRSQISLEQLVKLEIDEDDDEAGPRYEYYKSDKLLGQLYRAVDEGKIWLEDIHTEKTVTSGPSFWDQLLLHATDRCNEIGCSGWKERLEEARRIRSAYQGAIFSAMGDYSEHPIHPITELEVFTGHIINGTGVATRRQRDRSTKLRDEFDRISSWITDQMRLSGIPLTGYMTEMSAVDLCLACMYVGREEEGTELMSSRRDEYGDLKSFSVIAATALLAELRLFSQGMKGRNDLTNGRENRGGNGQTLPN